MMAAIGIIAPDPVATVFGEVITLPHRDQHRTVPSEYAPTNPPDAFVSGRDGQRTIEMPMDMLRAHWTWVVRDTPPLWQELRACQQVHAPRMTVPAWYDLDGYLSPLRLPAMAQEMFRVLSSAPPADQRTTLTVLGQNPHRRCADAPHVARRGGDRPPIRASCPVLRLGMPRWSSIGGRI